MDYSGLEKLGDVNENAKDDNRDDIEYNASWNTFCLSKISVSVWMTHRTVPKICQSKS